MNKLGIRCKICNKSVGLPPYNEVVCEECEREVIKAGDYAKFVWTDGVLSGRILHTPQNSGDMWYLDCGDLVVGINPQSQSLERIIIDKETRK